MRRMLIAASVFALAGAGAVKVLAIDVTGNATPANTTGLTGGFFNGSDTLFNFTRSVITQCGPGEGEPAFTTFVPTTYQGGGSGTGRGRMYTHDQELAPMSASLLGGPPGATVTAGGYCDARAVDEPGLPGLCTVGGDCTSGICTAGLCRCNAAADCAAGLSCPVAGQFCRRPTQATTQAMMVTLDAIIQSVDSTASCGSNAMNHGRAIGAYVPADSFDTLRLLYFGVRNNGARDCAAPERAALRASWDNLFQTTCPAGNAACPTGLKHAFRRGDLSGTTEAFVGIVGAPGAPVNPFCNANPTALNGRGSYQDLDPIRTPCDATTDDVCGVGNGTVAQRNTRGLVLPINQPDVPAATAALQYPLPDCDPGSCDLVAPGTAAQINAQLGLTGQAFACPGGTPTSSLVFLGRCFQPYRADASQPNGRNFSCFKRPGTPNCFGVLAAVQTTVYNLAAKQPNGSYFIESPSNIMATGSFYRLHYQRSPTGQLCRMGNDTNQIGCLVNANRCTTGFGGIGAALTAASPDTLGPRDINKALLLRAPGAAVAQSPFPEIPNITNILAAPGTLPFYPAARRLYVNSLVGYPQMAGDEQQLARCFGDTSITTAAGAIDGFVTTAPQCLDYPETAPVATPPANTQGPGGVSLAGCAAAGNTNSCATTPWPTRP